MFHFEQSIKVSSSQVSERQASRRELIKRFKMYTKKSNHETKHILKSKLLPLKDKNKSPRCRGIIESKSR